MDTLRTTAEREEALGSERPAILIPAREMLAGMSLDAKRPQPALAEYESTLKFNPNRFDSLMELIAPPNCVATLRNPETILLSF